MKAGASRLRAACNALNGEQRFAAIAAAALLGAMFLPWYEKSVQRSPGSQDFAQDAISAFGAVSFVEAAIFLVSAGVLALVLARAEGGRFHLPGGDGTVIVGAGLWACALIFYRVFDRPDVSGPGASVGIQWGFFVAFAAAGALALAGQRMRAAGRPEPPLRARRARGDAAPTDDDVEWSDARTEVVRTQPAVTRAVARTDRDEARGAPDADRDGARGAADAEGATARMPPDRAVTRADAERLALDDPPEAPLRPGQFPRARDRR